MKGSNGCLRRKWRVSGIFVHSMLTELSLRVLVEWSLEVRTGSTWHVIATSWIVNAVASFRHRSVPG
jgi:hypothetical protein